MSNILALHGGQPAVAAASYKPWPFYSHEVEAPIVELIRNAKIDAMDVDPFIHEFEERFISEYCPGSSAIFCSSGTAALFSAYFALGLDPGAEILVPTNTFRTTVTPLLLLNLRPVLCDIDPETGGIDLDDAEARITKRTQALVVTHMWGHPVDMEKVCSLAQKYKLALVEDCSHAHGATWSGKEIGTFGDVAAFSLGTKKLISGGMAGIVITRQRDIFERALVFGQPKHRADADMHDENLRQYLGSGFGANLRGTPFAAILALEHLKRLPSTIAIKNRNLMLLSDAITTHLPTLIPPARREHFTSGTWYMFQCSWEHQTVPQNLLFQALKAEGLRVSKPGDLLHRQRIFADPSPLSSYKFGRLPLCDPNTFPKADALFRRLITWDTREMYEPAETLIQNYAHAFQKVGQHLDQLIP